MPDPITSLNAALEGRYHIERELGRGGMATVYLAHDLKHDRKVALKVLKPELAAVVGAERFLAEIRTTANLQHPHILPLFDSGTADSFLYYVMPFVEGESLRDRLDREKQLPVEDAVRIATEVADALGHAHSKGVIHRDIKPANVLLRDGRVQVADFGIALAVNAAGGSRLTETGLSVGTPHYMSPEQATGDRELDGRSDVYSLGCVLYEMLAGEPPHTGPTAQSILSKILTEEARPVTELRRTVPAHVTAVLHRALQKLPADRFGRASDLAVALANPAFGLRSGGEMGPWGHLPTVRWRRIAIAALGIAGILTVLLVGALTRTGPTQAAIAEVTRLQLAIPDRGINEWGQTIVLSDDGRKMAYKGSDGAWWVKSFESLTSQQIDANGTLEHLTFSPDGESVAFRTGGWVGGLHVQSLAGDRLETLSNDVGAWGIDWGSDGRIYFTTTGAVLGRVHHLGGAVDTLSRLDGPAGEVGHAWPQLLPGGRYVVFTVLKGTFHDAERAELAVLDLETGERSSLIRGVFGRYVESGYLVYATGDNELRAVRMTLDPPGTIGSAAVIVPEVGVYGGWRGAEFALSETGSLIYVDNPAGLEDELVWVSRSGDIESIAADWGGRLGVPALSPDGTRMAVQLYRDRQPPVVYTLDLGTGALQRFSFGNVLDNGPHWAPDGGSILFAGPRPPERLNWDIYRKPTNGGPAVVVVDAHDDVGGPTLSRDGSWLVYYRDGGGGRDIWAARTQGDPEPVPIAVTDAYETDPRVSPDGRLVAFVSDETGEWEVWVETLGEAEGTRWQVSLNGGSAPRWGRAGAELFYVSPDQQLTVAEIGRGTGFAVVRRRVLFSLPELGLVSSYDVSSDGQQFVFVRERTRRAPGNVVLVLNFFELLKEKVG